MNEEPPLYIGINLPARQGLSNQTVVDAAISQGYDLITSRITSGTYRKRVQSLYNTNQDESLTPFPSGEDLVIFPGSHVSNTIALCAPWTELDSKDARIAQLSYKVLEHEISYAKFCGLPYVVIEGPKRRTHLARYAHSLGKLLKLFPDIKIMIHTTFTEDFLDSQPPPVLLSTWEVWDGVRTLCGHPENLGVALAVHRHRVPEFVTSRWFCEPIMMLVLGETSSFVPNPKNYPVLPKHIQQMVKHIAKLHPFFLIKENLWANKSVQFNGGDDACLIYLRNLLAVNPRESHQSHNSRASRHVDAESLVSTSSGSSGGSPQPPQIGQLERLQIAYDPSGSLADYDHMADVLEEPLEPLRSSLTSTVYDVFESDATKYSQYFKAIVYGIDHLNSIMTSGDVMCIGVYGAGRGPLVDRTLDAIASTGIQSQRPVKIYALELHDGPVSFLNARKASEPEWESVTVVKADMRAWVPIQPLNLIISELLGSFGDNELSPECLHFAENNPRVLAPDGIMIPHKYMSYVAPLYSPILWSKAKLNTSNGTERPYVVYIRQGELIAEPQSVWGFEHPLRSPRIGKTISRQAKVSFAAASKTRVYGFAGFFKAELFGGITINTLPNEHTVGLKSWFPIYFPISQPIDVFKDANIDISVWRESDRHKVWYEWVVETHYKRLRSSGSVVHNINGQSYSLHLH